MQWNAIRNKFAFNFFNRSDVYPLRAFGEKQLHHQQRPRFERYSSHHGSTKPSCGDVMKLQIKVDNDGYIRESRFLKFGCGSAIASSSYATEIVKGLHVNDAIVAFSLMRRVLTLTPQQGSEIAWLYFQQIRQ